MTPKAAAAPFQNLDDLHKVCDAVLNGISVQVLRGDITRVKTNVIVNASNTSLRNGAGINGAIHTADGPGLLTELAATYPVLSLGQSPGQTGRGYITGTHNLWPHVNAIVHAVGPDYGRGGSQAVNIMKGVQLRATYINSLDTANKTKMNSNLSICFPSISTGIFRFPQPEAARLALTAIRDWINVNPLGVPNSSGTLGRFNRIVVLLYDPNTPGNIDPNEAHYVALFRGIFTMATVNLPPAPGGGDA